MIVMLLYICQQVTGVQFVLGYSSYWFELAGFSNANAFKLGVGVLAVAVRPEAFRMKHTDSDSGCCRSLAMCWEFLLPTQRGVVQYSYGVFTLALSTAS